MQRPGPSQSVPLTSVASSGWSIVNSPNRFTIDQETVNFLVNVTCVSASDCWAVGDHSGSRTEEGIIRQTLIEHWDGTAWAVVISPNVNGPDLTDNFLTDVTCTSASECWAVGYYAIGFGGGARQPLIERWDGSSWAIVSSPTTDPSSDNLLFGVTCVSASNCWAAGYYIAAPDTKTLIEHWDGTSWAIVSSPNAPHSNLLLPGATSVLTDIACASQSACWAVGYNYENAVSFQPLIERWDGTSWIVDSSPTNTALQSAFLFGVTCASSSDCWAVGNQSPGSSGNVVTLIEHWDGVSWTVAASPDNPSATNQLIDVTCVSASDCWAVGVYDAGNVAGHVYQTLIEHWDGTTWSIVSSPNTGTSQQNALSGVTCLSASGCWAVGYGTGAYAYQTLTEHWNGTAWAIVSSPNAKSLGTSVLSDVTCVSASDCWAVGYDLAGSSRLTLIEHWDGTGWAIVGSGNTSPTQDNFLSGVTCVSSSDCWAVGYNVAGNYALQTLIEHWDGSSWTIVPSPNISPDKDGVVSRVTCVSASNCWASGYYNSTGIGLLSGGTFQTLVEHWDGSAWAIASSPNTNASESNVLSGLTCLSASNCWAVGHYHGAASDVDQTLIEHWNGAVWAIVSSPDTSATQINFLSGVACASASDCWAVGNYDSGTRLQTLIERWNGTTWAIVASPNTSNAQDNVLSAVACASTTDCRTVGSAFNGSVNQTLIERWDGSSWTVVSSPNSDSARNNVLSGVTCISASECWAVGYYKLGRVSQTLIEHYTAISPVAPTAVVSRKMHGTAGSFDVDLPLTGPRGIECRSGGPNGDYTMVFTFANPLTSVGNATVTSGTGSVSNRRIGADANQYIVDLTGVTNAQVITVSLANVNDSAGNSSVTVSASMRVLIGDTTADGFVNSGDIAQTKSQSGVALTNTNFREDVTAEGSINSGDIALVKSKSGTALP